MSPHYLLVQGDSEVNSRMSCASILDAQVIVPVTAVLAHLPQPVDGTVAVDEGALEALGKARCFAPDRPCVGCDIDLVDAENAA